MGTLQGYVLFVWFCLAMILLAAASDIQDTPGILRRETGATLLNGECCLSTQQERIKEILRASVVITVEINIRFVQELNSTSWVNGTIRDRRGEIKRSALNKHYKRTEKYSNIEVWETKITLIRVNCKRRVEGAMQQREQRNTGVFPRTSFFRIDVSRVIPVHEKVSLPSSLHSLRNPKLMPRGNKSPTTCCHPIHFSEYHVEQLTLYYALEIMSAMSSIQ